MDRELLKQDFCESDRQGAGGRFDRCKQRTAGSEFKLGGSPTEKLGRSVSVMDEELRQVERGKTSRKKINPSAGTA